MDAVLDRIPEALYAQPDNRQIKTDVKRNIYFMMAPPLTNPFDNHYSYK